MVKRLFILILFYFLVGCITQERVQKDYCEGLDTQKQGYLDASAGQPSDSFKGIISTCAKYEVKLSEAKYNEGYQKGIKHFCTKEKGYDLGVSGKKNLGICSNANIDSFSKGYEEGNKKCWHEIGYSNAKRGLPLSEFTNVGGCVLISKGQNKREYSEGWRKGIKIFCTHKTGYNWGLTGQKNPGICRGSAFLKGYQEGNKKCWYETGYSHAKNGRPSSNFTDVKGCITLSKKQSWVEYDKGWKKGMKTLCTLEGGYNWGLTGNSNPGICSKPRSAQFSEGYMKGVQQYEVNKRHQQLLNLERERIRAEKEQRQKELELERQRMQIEHVQKQRLLDLEQERIREEQQQKQQIINLERRKVREQKKTRKALLKLQKLGGRRLCKYNSDCGQNGRCRYDYNVKDYVCEYN